MSENISESDEIKPSDITNPKKIIPKAIGGVISGFGGIASKMLLDALKMVKNDILKAFVAWLAAGLANGYSKNELLSSFLNGVSAGSAIELAMALKNKFGKGALAPPETIGITSGSIAQAPTSYTYGEGDF